MFTGMDNREERLQQFCPTFTRCKHMLDHYIHAPESFF